MLRSQKIDIFCSFVATSSHNTNVVTCYRISHRLRPPPQQQNFLGDLNLLKYVDGGAKNIDYATVNKECY